VLVNAMLTVDSSGRTVIRSQLSVLIREVRIIQNANDTNI
jgi:hypothetical protein